MSRSVPERIVDFMGTWRMATTPNIRAGVLSSGDEIPLNTFKQSLKRLRRNRFIFTSRLGKLYVHFDYRLKRRWEYIEKLPVSDRLVFFSRSGIDHHLKMQRVALDFKNLPTVIDARPNVLSDTYSMNSGSVDTKERRHVPDLTVTAQDGEMRLLYIEVERSLKARERYLEKWRAYEADSSLSACLYVVYSIEMLERLTDLMTRYFDRKIGFPNYKMGILLDPYGTLKPDETVYEFSVGRSRMTSLEIFLRDRVNLTGRPPVDPCSTPEQVALPINAAKTATRGIFQADSPLSTSTGCSNESRRESAWKSEELLAADSEECYE